VDAVKRKIQEAEKALKNKRSTRGRLKTELRAFLNTLDLTKEQKNRLEGDVGDNTKNISALKRKAQAMVNRKKTNIIVTEMREDKARRRNVRNAARRREEQVKRVKAAKAFKENKNRKDRQLLKPRLEKHLYSLPNLSQKRIDEYLKSYMDGKNTIQKITTISSAKDKQFAKTKKRVATLLSKLPVKREVKNEFVKRLKTKRVNIDELKTNIRNTIIKQLIPAKEKKNLINQLLSKE
jgi:chromosome segregation ATPase